MSADLGRSDLHMSPPRKWGSWRAVAPSRVGVRRFVAPVVTCCLCLSLGVGSAHSASPSLHAPRVDQLAKLKIDARARQAVGRDYACTVTHRRRDKHWEVLVLVSGHDAVAAADRLAGKVGAAGRTRVLVVSRRYRARTTDAIASRLQLIATTRHYRATVWTETSESLIRCPRTFISYGPNATATPAVRHWAARSVRRYGRDRVGIREFMPYIPY